MRKYYLFSVSKETFQKYQEKSSSLYLLFCNLKKSKDLKNSYVLYQALCSPFDLERLYGYFTNKLKVTRKKHYVFLEGKLLLELNYSCLILLTEKQFPYLFRIFSYYSPYLFVCDFENGDYFWLNEILEKTR